MPEVTQMLMKELDKLGGRAWFPKLHHLIKPEFDSGMPSFDDHWKYCDRVGSFKPDEENVQTRRRLQAAIQAFKAGATWDDATTSAWNQHPLLTRGGASK